MTEAQKQPDYSMEISIRKGGVASVKQNAQIEMRGDSSLKMLLDALFKLVGQVGINRDITIHIGDYPQQAIEKDHFYYCIADEKDINHVIPDFVFDSWKLAGIENYTTTINEIISRGNQPYESEKLFWIGNVKTHRNRAKLMEIAQAHPDKIEAYDTMVRDKFLGKPASYISLPDHTKYKYLIDIEGNGYSGRIPFLLASQRVLFIQERKWKSYFHFSLEPYKHFIPVKNDLSNLLHQIKFMEAQGEEYYRKIAHNALEFVQNKLTYEKAVNVLLFKLLQAH
ncbi:glycosyl transferase family 90 [Cricetibacter osteomyelitidis]|uniref:Glycosyl transferase family 90 n=1 Tax=Cricetibacter osteomyelitidis TaxID=1521931 RepID=A0A4R2T5L9_9PAST|nr:glycosyl transferase family 90 [Cricetibacter osteomyelitidis]TCP96851.1 glycosyl transferase family 90 [Cricetibacter osteomyelitidis]